MDIGVSSRVVLRNNIGQFQRDCEEAAGETIREACERGAQLSRDFAPIGSKHDFRTVPLRESIHAKILSRTAGMWYANARHALPIEKGARPHDLPGNVRFFWEEEGRMWEPGENTIHHPGNAAQPYLKPAYDIIMRDIMRIAKSKYPG